MKLGLVIGDCLKKAVDKLGQEYDIEFTDDYADFCKKDFTKCNSIWHDVDRLEKVSFRMREVAGIGVPMADIAEDAAGS